ncbi:MAG: DNA repair protein RecO [Candidatus Omnitrophica bacterium]|nr:DNA repair protein RecO [Candidatus Omnitrophota bacterium]MDD5488085.1 DNA repair protein RecO [Candidatus Omnitrophota bacterium]
MAAHKAEGVILRKYQLRETSYILVVYTSEFGKIKGVIKGVRAPYPQFAGNFEALTKVSLLFYRKARKGLDLITACEATEGYYPVRNDIERLTYANYFIELIDTVSSDYDPNPALYEVLDKSLKMLASDVSPRRAGRIFELKMLEAIGVRPQLETCIVCGGAPGESVVFDVAGGGIRCASCSEGKSSATHVSRGTLRFMENILNRDIERTGHIKVSREVGREMEGILKAFISFHVGRQARSMRFIEHLQARGIVQQ